MPRLIGDLFNPGPAVSGCKSRSAKTWKYCPYSTQIEDYNQDARVPNGERTYHQETEGRMHSYSLGAVMGWVCADNECSYYTGSATTEVIQHGRKFVTASGTTARSANDLATLSGSVSHLTQGRTIISGTRFYEI